MGITRNAQRAQELGPNVEIRWHSQPVTTWFVIIDRSHVAFKPYDLTRKTLPSFETRSETLDYYVRLFDPIWVSASKEHTAVLNLQEYPSHEFATMRVFLCHSSEDKPAVRELYDRLVSLGIDVWLDERKILPGQRWDREIRHAIKEAHVVIVCLSHRSIVRKGYMQSELRNVLEIGQQYPEDTVFIIPARLDDCVVPEDLSHLQWVNIYDNHGYERLIESLRLRATRLI